MTTSITGCCACEPFNGSGSYAAAGTLRTDAVYTRASDIVIQTLEGDRVTISSSSYKAGGYEAYEALAVGKNAAARQYGESAWFESRSRLSLSVAGDLNEKELGDIQKIIRTLDKMMDDLAAGDLEGALAGNAKFAGIDSIASFSADMSITARIAVSSYQRVSTSIPSPVSRDGGNHAFERIDRAADNFIKGMNTKTALSGNLISALEKYFSDWLEKPHFEGKGAQEGQEWASRFARRLMHGLEGRMLSEEQGDKSPRAEELKIGV